MNGTHTKPEVKTLSYPATVSVTDYEQTPWYYSVLNYVDQNGINRTEKYKLATLST